MSANGSSQAAWAAAAAAHSASASSRVREGMVWGWQGTGPAHAGTEGRAGAGGELGKPVKDDERRAAGGGRGPTTTTGHMRRGGAAPGLSPHASRANSSFGRLLGAAASAFTQASTAMGRHVGRPLHSPEEDAFDSLVRNWRVEEAAGV